MIRLPIVIVAWSPIGYETFLSLCEMYGESNVLLISARNFAPLEARFSMGVQNDYFLQSNGEIKLACESLEKCFAAIANFGTEFTLCAPQMGNFYTRTLLESQLCTDLIVYDEGSAAYFDNVTRLQNVIWMRKKVEETNVLREYLENAHCDFDALKDLYQTGVKFYEFKHRKIRSLISFFPDAFPKFNKIKIPFKSLQSSSPNIDDRDILITLPKLKRISIRENCQKYLDDIERIKCTMPKPNFVIKPHPSDFEVSFATYRKLLALPESRDYSGYMSLKGLNPYREPAISGFKTIITYDNSTKIYVEQLQKMHGSM